MIEKELPEGWVEKQLIELLDKLENGSRPKGGVQGIFEGVPSLGGEHLNYDGGFKFDRIKYVPFEFADKMRRGLIQFGDILIVKDGATTGKTSFVDKNFPFKIAYVNEHVFICRTNISVGSKYLNYYLRSDQGQERLLDNFTGSAQGGINQQFANNLLVPVAGLSEQKRIVAKLDEAFKHIENLKIKLDRIPVLLKQFKETVLTYAVTGKLTEDWRKGKTLETSEELVKSIIEKRMRDYMFSCSVAKKNSERKPTKMYLMDLPVIEQIDIKLPQNWFQTNVHFLAFVTKLAGFEYTDHFKLIEDGGVPVVRAQNVQMGRFEDKNRQYISEETSDFLIRSQLQGREILMVFIGAGTGNVCLAPKVERWHLAPNVAKIDVDGISTEYLYYYLQSQLGVTNVLSRVKATAQPSLSMETIRDIVTIVPPLEEQQEIVQKVESLFSIADKIENQYKTLKAKTDKLPKALLSKAFKGKLVAQNPTNGDAKSLLYAVDQLPELLQVAEEEVVYKKMKR